MAKAKYTKAQEDALKALGNPKVIKDYDDGSLDIEFGGATVAMGTDGQVMTPSEYVRKVYDPWKKKQGKKKGTTTPVYHFTPIKTPCEREPKLCAPRDVKHVAWDADDTIWDIKPYGIASNISGKLSLVDPDTVVEERTYTKYKPVQSQFEPYDEGLRFKYGYRYGDQHGFTLEAEDLEKLWDTKLAGGKEKEFYLRELDQKEYEEVMNAIYKMAPTLGNKQDILDELNIKYHLWPDPEGELEDIVDDIIASTEPPSATELEVEEIMKELTDELSEQHKEALGLPNAEIKQLPPGKPEKKEEYTTKTTIKLMPGYRDLLDTLKEQGVTNSIISLNTEGTVKRIIDKFGLSDHFLEIRDSWDKKGKVFTEQMKTFGYKPKEAMFVDNTQSHVEEVATSGAVPLVYGKDIKEVAQIVNYMTNA